MIGQTLATVLGLIIAGALIIIDIWLVLDRLPGNTWSELLRELSRDTLFIPWSLGVLIGHWFHPVDDLQPVAGGASIWLLIGLTVILVVVGLILRFAAKFTPPAWPWALAGMVAGAALWPVQVAP